MGEEKREGEDKWVEVLRDSGQKASKDFRSDFIHRLCNLCYAKNNSIIPKRYSGCIWDMLTKSVGGAQYVLSIQMVQEVLILNNGEQAKDPRQYQVLKANTQWLREEQLRRKKREEDRPCGGKYYGGGYFEALKKTAEGGLRDWEHRVGLMGMPLLYPVPQKATALDPTAPMVPFLTLAVDCKTGDEYKMRGNGPAVTLQTSPDDTVGFAGFANYFRLYHHKPELPPTLGKDFEQLPEELEEAKKIWRRRKEVRRGWGEEGD